MPWVMVDVEADGPCPGLFSMVKLGAVVVERPLRRTFYAELHPLEGALFMSEALAACHLTREETLGYPGAADGMEMFNEWLCGLSPVSGARNLRFVSDNNGFDWQFVNYYFWRLLGWNPFGHSSTNLGSLYKGVVQNLSQSFKHLRRTPHDHHPVHDAMGNAEAMLEVLDMIRGKQSQNG